MRGRSDRHLSRPALIAEAQWALRALLTAEGSYFQKWGTFTTTADTADIRITLGAYLDVPSRRWTFSVDSASDTGFVATARGRPGTKADGIIVTVRYVRNQLPQWTVENTRKDHGPRPLREPRAVLIGEAKGGLAALHTGEQVYFQKWGGTYSDVVNNADALVTLGVDLADLGGRWDFSVSAASETGFVAKARGRADTVAEGIAVTLSYQRGQPLVWTIEHAHPRRK